MRLCHPLLCLMSTHLSMRFHPPLRNLKGSGMATLWICEIYHLGSQLVIHLKYFISTANTEEKLTVEEKKCPNYPNRVNCNGELRMSLMMNIPNWNSTCDLLILKQHITRCSHSLMHVVIIKLKEHSTSPWAPVMNPSAKYSLTINGPYPGGKVRDHGMDSLPITKTQ